MRPKEKNREYMKSWRVKNPDYDKTKKQRQRIMDNFRRREAFTHIVVMHPEMTIQTFKKLLKKGYTLHEMSSVHFHDETLFPKKVS